MSKALPVLAATLLLAAGAGCGDDKGNDAAGGDGSPPATATVATEREPEPEPAPADSTATRPEPPPDQGRYARQVDEACAPAQRTIDAVFPPANAAGLERWLADTLPLVRKQVAAVKALKPPAKEEEARRARLFVGGLEKLESSLTKYLAAIRLGDPAAVQKAVTEAGAAGSETRGYAASLGITKCGGYSSG